MFFLHKNDLKKDANHLTINFSISRDFAVRIKHQGCRMPEFPHKAMQPADSNGHIHLALR